MNDLAVGLGLLYGDVRKAEIFAYLDAVAMSGIGPERDVCPSQLLGLFPEDARDPAAVDLQRDRAGIDDDFAIMIFILHDGAGGTE